MKRILAVVLVLAMALSLLPLTAFAAEVASGTSGDVQWVLTDDGTLTFSGEGAMADYATTNATPWKAYAPNITKIVFESGVTHIGNYAFQSNTTLKYSNLTEVVMEDVETIGIYAFRYAEALSTVSFGPELSYIGPSAFSFCSSLDGIVFPDTLKMIDHEAFNYCSSLTQIVIPENTETIEYSAFGNCTALTDAWFPEDITYIGTHIFNFSKNVTVHGYTDSFAYMYCLLGSIAFDSVGTAAEPVVYASGDCGDLKWEFYSDGTLKITGEGAMDDYTSSTYTSAPWIAYARQTEKVIIDEGVTHVGACAFYNSSSTYYPKLTEVEILGDASIGEAAFKYGKETSIVLSGECSSIGTEAFAENSNLTEIILPEGLTEIGDAAFRRCSGLTELVIPDSVTEIGANAFYYCNSLATISFDGEAPAIGSSAFYGVKATAYYHKGMESWTDDVLAGYGGKLTWVSFTYESVVTDPTCTEQGFTTYSCTHCDFTYDGDFVDALGHDYIGVVTDPTCTAEGYTTYTCSRCEDSYVDDYTEKASHEYEAVVTAPTCTEQGYTTYTCKNCPDSYVDDYTEALGHDYVPAVTEPTCTEQGYTTYTCSRCEDSYMDDYTEKASHEYEAVATAPTCTEQGYTTYTCKNCPDSYVDDYTEALGHDYVPAVTEPTCTEQGYTTYTCSRCEDSYVADYTEKVPHEYEETVIAPTCTEQGCTMHTCKNCEESYADTYTDALGHDYTSTYEAPTCAKEGHITYTCSRCGDTYIETIAALDCPTADYTDVPKASNWAHAGIDFCVDRGIMGSTTTKSLIFEPATACSRAMIVSILYRLSGEPDVDYEAAFPDVPKGQWYSDAVIWAYHNGVVVGYDSGLFGPTDLITREQMAVILKGYTQKILRKATDEKAELTDFADANKVKWSKDYVKWAVAVGMISGKTQDDTVILDPQGNATRAEVASILMRYIQNIVES